MNTIGQSIDNLSWQLPVMAYLWVVCAALVPIFVLGGPDICLRWELRPDICLRMLFHNRPVKAAMGLVIVNGGVQLSGGKSLVNTKLVTLHFGLGEDKLVDLNSELSDVS